MRYTIIFHHIHDLTIFTMNPAITANLPFFFFLIFIYVRLFR